MLQHAKYSKQIIFWDILYMLLRYKRGEGGDKSGYTVAYTCIRPGRFKKSQVDQPNSGNLPSIPSWLLSPPFPSSWSPSPAAGNHELSPSGFWPSRGTFPGEAGPVTGVDPSGLSGAVPVWPGWGRFGSTMPGSPREGPGPGDPKWLTPSARLESSGRMCLSVTLVRIADDCVVPAVSLSKLMPGSTSAAIWSKMEKTPGLREVDSGWGGGWTPCAPSVASTSDAAGERSNKSPHPWSVSRVAVTSVAMTTVPGSESVRVSESPGTECGSLVSTVTESTKLEDGEVAAMADDRTVWIPELEMLVSESVTEDVVSPLEAKLAQPCTGDKGETVMVSAVLESAGVKSLLGTAALGAAVTNGGSTSRSQTWWVQIHPGHSGSIPASSHTFFITGTDPPPLPPHPLALPRKHTHSYTLTHTHTRALACYSYRWGLTVLS